MAININQLNVPALAALAGNSAPRLDLPVIGPQPGLFQKGPLRALYKGSRAQMRTADAVIIGAGVSAA